MTPEVTGPHRARVRALVKDLPGDPEPEDMERNRQSLAAALEEFKEAARAAQCRKDEDLRAMVASMAEAVGALALHGDRQSARIKQFTVRLQLVAKGTDLAKMREELARQVADLRDLGSSMSQDNSAPVREMQARLNEFQERLESAERRASTDSLTGLMNRGEAESRLQRQLKDNEIFSVILIDLNGFKQINDRWGHTCGDQVLRSFAALLANSVRVSDLVCRWGGDEFLIAPRCTGAVAEQRAIELRARLTSQHKLGPPGRTCDVVVGASLGVGEAQPGDSLEDLIARADVDLYRHKSKKGRGEPARSQVLAAKLPVPG